MVSNVTIFDPFIKSMHKNSDNKIIMHFYWDGCSHIYMCITYVIPVRNSSIIPRIPLSLVGVAYHRELLINSNLISMDSDVTSFS